MEIQRRKNLFPIEFSSIEQIHAVVKDEDVADLWHSRYAHLNFQGLHVLHAQNMVIGLPRVKKVQHCEDCVFGKLKRLTSKTGRSWRAKHKLYLVHADVCGPMQNESNGGNMYFLLFVDDYSRMSWVYVLKFKHEVLTCFKNFLALVERQSGKKLKILRTNKGREFLSKDFNLLCDQMALSMN